MAEENQRTAETESRTQLRGTLENRAAKPAGLLPKNTQQLVILGVAVAMVLIMWLTGGTKRAGSSTTPTSAAPGTQALNSATVEDFKQTIQREQAAARQPVAPPSLARLRSLGLAGDLPPGSTLVPPDGDPPQPGVIASGTGTGATPDLVREDKKKREYLSLFATNVAFTSRREPGSQPRETDSPGPDGGRPLRAPELDTQVRQAEAQFAAANPNTTPETQGASGVPRPEKQTATEAERLNRDASRPGAFNSFTGKRYVLFEGTVLETLLINRLNGTFSGPVNCLVTTDIYSHDRQHVLVPAGSKVLGEAKKVEVFGQQRLAVFFHRLIMPDGYSVTLDQFKGLDQVGETALRGKVNNHYAQIFSASLAIGILGGVAEAGTGNALTNSSFDRVRQGFGASLANSSMEILDRFLNILPTVTIREGHRVKVYLSGDLLLPDYSQHGVQPDL